MGEIVDKITLLPNPYTKEEDIAIFKGTGKDTEEAFPKIES